jgi:hypothetical protein
MTRPEAPAHRVSDRDAAVLRRARFGHLPARIAPDDWVEETDTDPPAHELERSMPIVQAPGQVNET